MGRLALADYKRVLEEQMALRAAGEDDRSEELDDRAGAAWNKMTDREREAGRAYYYELYAKLPAAFRYADAMRVLAQYGPGPISDAAARGRRTWTRRRDEAWAEMSEEERARAV